MKKINKKDIKSTAGFLKDTQQLILKSLGASIIFQTSELLIAFHGLACFGFCAGKYDLADEKSIALQCAAVLQAFDMYEKGKLDDYLKRNSTEKDVDPIHHFVKYVVGFHQLPAKIVVDLERKVRANLQELQVLIDRYESDPVIIDYQNGMRRPQHSSKVRIDFYERCKVEQSVILRYLLYELEERAIAKAMQDESFNSFGFLWYEGFWDRPYKWWQHRSIEYFDYRKINVCRHRLDEVVISEIPVLEELYISNKKLFYRRLGKIMPPSEIFRQIKSYYVPSLPKVIERKPVMDELEKLMKAKRWYGFTALALTQVEGIFSDMLHILHPSKNYSSLSTKASAIRNHYHPEGRNFDYFEYHLPELRNSFLHSGSIRNNDFRLISLDLLYDLFYLLTVFLQLNDPHMELHKFLTKNSTESIHGIASLNHLFNLVDEVQKRSAKNPSHAELRKTLEQWNQFRKDVLMPSTEVELLVREEIVPLPGKIDRLFETFRAQTAYDGVEIDFSKMNVKAIQDKAGSLQLVYTERLYHLKEDYKNILSALKFMNRYKIFLPEASEDMQKEIGNIPKENKGKLDKALALQVVFEFC